MLIDKVRQFVYENFENITEKSNGYHFRCPICGDSEKSKYKKRFHLTLKNDSYVYRCFNCDATGNIYTLYAELKDVTTKEAWKYFNYQQYNNKSILKKINKLNTIEEEKSVKKENFNWILNHCITVDSKVEGYTDKKYQETLKKFINDRKLTIPVFYCYEGNFKDRIVIPVYENNNIVFFQARSIHENPSIKYLNPKTEKSHIIFNNDQLNPKKVIYITEGLLDAQSIESNSTCCLGKEITDDWIIFFNKEIQLKNNYENLCIILDNDKAGKESLKKILKYSKYNKILKYFIMPNKFSHIKDINMLKSIYVDMNISRFIDENTYTWWKLKRMEF